MSLLAAKAKAAKAAVDLVKASAPPVVMAPPPPLTIPAPVSVAPSKGLDVERERTYLPPPIVAPTLPVAIIPPAPPPPPPPVVVAAPKSFPTAAPIPVAPLTAPTPVVVATPEVSNGNGGDMSLLKKVAGAAAKIGGGAIGGLIGGPAGAAVGAKLGSSLAGRIVSSAPKLTGPAATMSALPAVVPQNLSIGGVVQGARKAAEIAGYAGAIKGLIPGGGGGCGCNGSSGRDSCTGQRLSSARAPEATFFGGCCPPGRVLRRQPWARDICIKRPKMNPFNPSALARADRRITQFSRRSSAILRGMGFTVTRTRKISGVQTGGPKRRGRGRR